MNKFVGKLVGIGQSVRGAWLTLKFLTYLNKIKAFNNNDEKTVLRVIQRYIELVTPTYLNSSRIMSRDINQSSMLLSALIDKWFRDKSGVTIEQILEVLRNEFIGRENGR